MIITNNIEKRILVFFIELCKRFILFLCEYLMYIIFSFGSMLMRIYTCLCIVYSFRIRVSVGIAMTLFLIGSYVSWNFFERMNRFML